MRITGGELRGRRLKTPPGADVRPTQDMVREALFSMLQEVVPESSFLDLFAGSGSVGIEAWSRGARSVTWVEGSRKVAQTLEGNVNTLCDANPGRVFVEDVFKWIARPLSGAEKFDIVFADPPYSVEGRSDGIENVIVALSGAGKLAKDAIFVAEQRTGSPLPDAPGWDMAKERHYGNSRILIFKWKNGGEE